MAGSFPASTGSWLLVTLRSATRNNVLASARVTANNRTSTLSAGSSFENKGNRKPPTTDAPSTTHFQTPASSKRALIADHFRNWSKALRALIHHMRQLSHETALAGVAMDRQIPPRIPPMRKRLGNYQIDPLPNLRSSVRRLDVRRQHIPRSCLVECGAVCTVAWTGGRAGRQVCGCSDGNVRHITRWDWI